MNETESDPSRREHLPDERAWRVGFVWHCVTGCGAGARGCYALLDIGFVRDE